MNDNQDQTTMEGREDSAVDQVQTAFTFSQEALPEPESQPGIGPTNAASPEAEAGDDRAGTANPKLDLAKIRDLILLAHEDVVPELVAGETFEELLASIEPARQAFQQVADRIVRSSSGANLAAGLKTIGTAKVGPIPAGQPGRAATHDPQAASLNPSAKIAEGLRRRVG